MYSWRFKKLASQTYETIVVLIASRYALDAVACGLPLNEKKDVPSTLSNLLCLNYF